MDDDELLAAVGQGDRAAFATLYDHWVRSVIGVVREVVPDRARTETITREVFVELWRRAPRFDPRRGAAAPWIMIMAHRRAVDACDARDDAVGTAAAREPEVDEAMDALDATQREAIDLAFYGGHTDREVGALLDAPLATVRTLIRDGLVRLRDVLGAPGTVRGDQAPGGGAPHQENDR